MSNAVKPKIRDKEGEQPLKNVLARITFSIPRLDDLPVLSITKNCTDDCSQCFNYADVWDNPEISNDNGGKNNNRYNKGSKRKHKGVDIISGATYKDVHSLMCGTVEAIVNSYKTNQYGYLKLGNVVNVKSKDKNGKTVYILYCHLDKVYVKKGDKVKHGQKIALSGSTGNAAEILDEKGKLKNGIYRKNWHVHIEACSNGSEAVTFYGKDRLQPEDYMKTKFNEDGNAIEEIKETKSDSYKNNWRKRALEEDLEKIKLPQDNTRVAKSPLPIDLNKRLSK